MHKKIPIFFVILCIAITPSVFAKKKKANPYAEWYAHASEEGRYSIYMPAKPQLKKNTQKTKEGVIETNIASHEAQSSAYMVSYTDYPASLMVGLSPQQFIEKEADGIIKSMKGIVKARKSMVFGDEIPKKTRSKLRKKHKLPAYPGVAIDMLIMNGDGMYYARLYLAGNRVFRVVLTCSKDYPASQAAMFFQSLRL